MSLLPESAGFAEVVQDAFAALRGRGLMLSALDAEQLRAWTALDVPAEVVIWGLRRAAERVLWDARPGELGPRSLRGCRREVEEEIAAWRARAVGASVPERTAPPLESSTDRLLRALVRQAGGPSLARRAAAERLLLAAGFDPLAADRRAAFVLRGLAFPERLSILRAAAQGVVEDGLSPLARKLARRVRRLALVARLPGAVPSLPSR